MRKVILILLIYSTTLNVWASLQFHTIYPNEELFTSGIVNIVQDANGFMWIAQGEDVQRYDGYNFKSYKSRFERTKSSPFRGIACTSNGDIYVANSNSIFQYKARVDSFVCVYHTAVRRLSVDGNDNLWIYGNEVGYYSTSLQQYVPLLINRKSVQGKVFASPHSNTFILAKDSKLFSIAKDGRVDSLDVLQNIPNVTGMYADSINLYILCENGAIQKINHHTSERESINVQYNADVYTKYIYIAPNQDMWIGTMQGLYVYNPTTNRTRHYLHSLKTNALADNSIWTIYQDRSANIWLGTYSGAISVVYSVDNGANIKIRPQDYGFAIPAVRALALDEEKNILWFGTEGSGLFKITNIDSQNNMRIEQTLSYPTNIKSLHLHNNNLWVGSYLGGLQCLNTKTFALTNYSHLLLNNQIRCFFIDSMENIWITYQSNSDLVTKFNLAQHTTEHFAIDSEEAKPYILQGKSQNVITSSHGKIYSAAIDGIYVIDSANIIQNNVSPNTLISKIRIKGKERPVNTEIVLKHNDYYIEIELASSNMIYPEKNNYSYCLTKLGIINRSSEWQNLPSNNRIINFPQLAAGRYILKMKSANNDGKWGEPIQLKIVVKPVFWASTWAVLIYLSIAFILSKLIYHNITSHRKLQNEIYLAHQRQLDAERMNKSKMRFFANVSNEFTLPLQKTLATSTDQNVNTTIQEMIHTMNRYTEEYCIDTSKNASQDKVEKDLDTLRDLVAASIEGGRKIDLDQLAVDMGMSRRKLFDLVKNNLGKSIVQYIRAYRISLATKYMVEEGLSSKEAMFKVGIDSMSYFIKAFKIEYGESPASFIAKLQHKMNKETKSS